MTIDIERLKVDREYWDSVAPDWARFYYPVSGFFISHSLGIANAIPRPEPRQVEWDGEGLPPVGVECEIAEHRPERGHRLYIFAHHAGHAFGWDEVEDSAYFSDDPDDFRPIRTKEQREREELINLMMVTRSESTGGDALVVCADAILSHYNLEPKP